METQMNRSRTQSSPSSQVKRGISDSSDAISQVKSQASDVISQVRSQASEWASSASDIASDYVKTGTEFVKNDPIRGAGYAAAAGAVIGCLLTLAFTRD